MSICQTSSTSLYMPAQNISRDATPFPENHPNMHSSSPVYESQFHPPTIIPSYKSQPNHFSRLSSTRFTSAHPLTMALEGNAGDSYVYDESLFDRFPPAWPDGNHVVPQREGPTFFPHTPADFPYAMAATMPMPMSSDLAREDELMGSLSSDMSYFDFAPSEHLSSYNQVPTLSRNSPMIPTTGTSFYFDGAGMDISGISGLPYTMPMSAPATSSLSAVLPDELFDPSTEIPRLSSTPHTSANNESTAQDAHLHNGSPSQDNSETQLATKTESDIQDMDDVVVSTAASQSSPSFPSASPPDLIHESDSDDAGESEVEDGDDGDGDFVPNARYKTRGRPVTRSSSRRTVATKEAATASPESSRSVSSKTHTSGHPRVYKLTAPTPVPNLTKKSRGRRVPTSPVLVVQGGVQKNARGYTCKVKGCGKCFARGEHLKRHVRSIHTNEKPHKCPVPGCDKAFSRHDNLGQHMRVHKGSGGSGDEL